MKTTLFCIASVMMLCGVCLAGGEGKPNGQLPPSPRPEPPKVETPAPQPPQPKPARKEEKLRGTLAKPDAFERFQPIPLAEGQPVYLMVEKNHQLRIPLAENGTTGYIWSVECSNPKVMELKNDNFLLPKHDKGMVGVGGVRVFTFKAKAEGTAILTFCNSRPWEKDSQAPRYQVVVLVQEDD